MKAQKRFLSTGLAAQVMAVPVLLTVVFLYLLSDLGKFNNMFGERGGRLVLLLLMAGISLVVGIAMGFLVAARDKTEVPTRYRTLLIPIIYALLLAVVVAVASGGSPTSGWWLIHFFKNPLFFVFGFAALFSGTHYMLPVSELMGYSGYLLGTFLYDMFLKEEKHVLPGPIKKGFALMAVAVVLFSGITNARLISDGYIELRYGRSTVGSDLNEFDVLQIAPFRENNGLAKLDRPASLQFTDFATMPRLDGATALYPVYAAFVEAVYPALGEYYNEHKDSTDKNIYSAFVYSEEFPLNIVMCTKTSTAYERLINGETDIIFVLEPSKEHSEKIRSMGDDFRLTPIGSEAFVFFTNINNPVENLTIKQIQDIYSGKITNWRQLGGENRKIVPYQRPENSGSQTIMQNRVMKDVPMSEPTTETFAGGMG